MDESRHNQYLGVYVPGIYWPNYLAIHIHLHFLWSPFFIEQCNQGETKARLVIFFHQLRLILVLLEKQSSPGRFIKCNSVPITRVNPSESLMGAVHRTGSASIERFI